MSLHVEIANVNENVFAGDFLNFVKTGQSFFAKKCTLDEANACAMESGIVGSSIRIACGEIDRDAKALKMQERGHDDIQKYFIAQPHCISISNPNLCITLSGSEVKMSPVPGVGPIKNVAVIAGVIYAIRSDGEKDVSWRWVEPCASDTISVGGWYERVSGIAAATEEKPVDIMAVTRGMCK